MSFKGSLVSDDKALVYRHADNSKSPWPSAFVFAICDLVSRVEFNSPIKYLSEEISIKDGGGEGRGKRS